MKKKIILTIALGFLLIGCSSTGVIPMSQDSYFIGKKDGYPGIGVSLSNKAEVYQEANVFCIKKGLEVMTLRETLIPAAPGRLGSTELHFKCVKCSHASTWPPIRINTWPVEKVKNILALL